MWKLFAVLALAAAVPADVTVTRLDGTSAVGPLQAWSAQELVLGTGSGTQAIPAADMLSIAFSSQSTADSGQPLVELVDGTVLPIAGFAADHRLATVRLRPSSGSPQQLVVPLEQVWAVRLLPLDAAIFPQWQEIRALGVPSDLIVVRQRSGKSLDHLEGVLGRIDEREVEFTLDGKTVRVPRRRVAGLLYYRSSEPAGTKPYCLLMGQDGLRIPAAKIDWRGQAILAHTAAGLQLVWPLAAIATADFSADKLVFLSDMEPIEKTWRPLVSLPVAASRAAKYGQPRFNQSAAGGPLTLAFPAEPPADASARIESFAKGLAIRSRTELIYRLPQGYRRLLAMAGIEPAAAASGDVMLSVVGDDRLLAEFAVTGNAAPVPLDLDVAGVRRLKIVVDYGENLDTGDWLNLCNARIVK